MAAGAGVVVGVDETIALISSPTTNSVIKMPRGETLVVDWGA
jgi:hypothetical protein